MGLRKRKTPERKPHPDARVEADLQQIIALRRLADRKQSSLDDLQEDIRRCRSLARAEAGYKAGREATAMADKLQDETMPRIEAEVQAMQDQIRKAIEPMNDTDLAYLD